MNTILKYIISCLIIFSLQSESLIAQNLIPNGSFEQTRKGYDCPWNFGELMIAKGWFIPNTATPDLYGKCTGRYLNTGIPKNIRGYQKCDSGNYYAGIICYTEGMIYKEYISTKLTKKLQKDKTYCVKYNYSLSNYSGFKFNSLGAIFTSKKPGIKNSAPINKYSISQSIVNDTSKWQQFACLYTANGTEKYITIGSFKNDMEFAELSLDRENITISEITGAGQAYYYIDNVAVIATDNEQECKCSVPNEKKDTIVVTVPKPPTLKTEEVYIFKELTFETNSFMIDPVSYKELDSLAHYLSSHPDIRIEISGHTDNTGKESDNQKLSENRASSVYRYLTEYGINIQRMSYKGFGSGKPLFPNDTEEHKKANRRVEFILKEY